MAGTVVAAFETHEEAEQAARGLVDAGILMNDISIIRKDAAGEHGVADDDVAQRAADHEEVTAHGFREVPVHDLTNVSPASNEVMPRTAVGVVAGSSMGALLVASAVFIPGIGPLVVAGPLAAMVIGSLAGGAAGGLAGALSAGGVPVDTAQRYHDYVERGSTLVAALASTSTEGQVEDILRRYGGSDVAYVQRMEDTVQRLES